MFKRKHFDVCLVGPYANAHQHESRNVFALRHHCGGILTFMAVSNGLDSHALRPGSIYTGGGTFDTLMELRGD